MTFSTEAGTTSEREYERAVKRLSVAVADPGTYTRDAAHFDAVKLVAQKGLEAGVAPERYAGGQMLGTYFLQDLTGQRIAVFKPGDEEIFSDDAVRLKSRIGRFVARFVPGSELLRYCLDGRGYRAEVAASIISQDLGLDNVPFTRTAALVHPGFAYSKARRNGSSELPKKTGSLQTYVRGSNQELRDYLLIDHEGRRSERWLMEHFEKSRVKERLRDGILPLEFEKLGLTEFLVGKLDGFLSNCLIDARSGKLYSIDHAQGMPHKHVVNWTLPAQYRLRLLPQARRALSAQARSHAETAARLQDRLVEKLVELTSIEQAQAQRLRERIAVLVKFAREGRTLLELLRMRSAEEFTACLG